MKNTVVLTRKRFLPISWYNITTNNVSSNQLYFSSSREPPPSGQEKETEKNRHHHQKPIQRSKNWKQTRRRKHEQPRREKHEVSPSLFQSSQYSYKIFSGKDTASTLNSSHSSPKMRGNTAATTTMQSMNASALLDPLNYCKGSAKLAKHVNNGGRSISGTDAARRLLRGKKDFLSAAGKLDAPVLLDGHGVPPALFQYCVDMADALLRYYGPDVVECSFHNYYSNDNNTSSSSSKTPLHVRVRRRDGTNSCFPPPSTNEMSINSRNGENYRIGEGGIDCTDWDYNITLYLTVMERLAKSLGQVLKPSSTKNDHGTNLTSFRSNRIDNKNSDEDGNFSSPPLLCVPPQPRWSVDILRGAYFDFQPIGNSAVLNKNNSIGRLQHKNKDTKRKWNGDEGLANGRDLHVESRGRDDGDAICDIRPFPVVEFVQQQNSRSSGHVLIRLQGCAVPNEEFGEVNLQGQPQQPVTLVFDACFQTPIKGKQT